MVRPFNTSQVDELILDRIWFHWPTLATNLGDNLMVVLETPIFRPVLIRLAVEHE